MKVFGVHHGGSRSDTAVLEHDAWLDTNRGAYLPPRAETMRSFHSSRRKDYRTMFDGKPAYRAYRTHPSSNFFATRAGSASGTGHHFQCPDGYVASGLIHSNSTMEVASAFPTATFGWFGVRVNSTRQESVVGNIGLVCTLYSPYRDTSLHTARVFASGSEDIDRVGGVGYVDGPKSSPAEGDDYTRYMQMAVSTVDVSARQEATLCPAGSFMTAVELGHDGNHIRNIFKISCTRYSGGTPRDVITRTGAGVGDEPSGVSTQQERFSCLAGDLIRGITIHTDGVARGLQFGCARKPAAHSGFEFVYGP
jgi:hypothetical protein